MTVPITLVMIKPMSIGRGHGPAILSDLLKHCPITLRSFRSWQICNTTLDFLCDLTELDYNQEQIHLARKIDSWICIFTHIDRVTDPTELIKDYCGPDDPALCKASHLRYQYGGYGLIGKTAHPSDTVVHISTSDKVDLESDMLILNFDKEKI